MPVIDLNKIKTENHWTNKIKDKARNLGRTVKEKAKEGMDFVKENPQTTATLLAAGGTLLGIAHKITKGVQRNVNLRQEKYNKERYIYDHSLNMYLKTKRPLRKADYDRITSMRKNGMKLNEALSKLDLLK